MAAGSVGAKTAIVRIRTLLNGTIEVPLTGTGVEVMAVDAGVTDAGTSADAAGEAADAAVGLDAGTQSPVDGDLTYYGCGCSGGGLPDPSGGIAIAVLLFAFGLRRRLRGTQA